jgi:hypothetical protein
MQASDLEFCRQLKRGKDPGILVVPESGGVVHGEERK